MDPSKRSNDKGKGKAKEQEQEQNEDFLIAPGFLSSVGFTNWTTTGLIGAAVHDTTCNSDSKASNSNDQGTNPTVLASDNQASTSRARVGNPTVHESKRQAPNSTDFETNRTVHEAHNLATEQASNNGGSAINPTEQTSDGNDGAASRNGSVADPSNQAVTPEQQAHLTQFLQQMANPMADEDFPWAEWEAFINDTPQNSEHTDEAAMQGGDSRSNKRKLQKPADKPEPEADQVEGGKAEDEQAEDESSMKD